MLACAYAHDRSLIRTARDDLNASARKSTNGYLRHRRARRSSMVRVLAARSARAEPEDEGRLARSLDDGSMALQAAFLENVPSGRR